MFSQQIERISLLNDQSSNPDSYYLETPQAKILSREINTQFHHLFTLLEEWNLHTNIHCNSPSRSQKSCYQANTTPHLPPSLQSHLADYNHRQRVLEIVKPYMTIASLALQNNPEPRQSINCPYCGKYFKGPKFWKRFHQHRRDAHKNHHCVVINQ